MIDVLGADLAWWQALLSIVVAIVGSARLTRIVTYDDYPPAIRLRIWWQTVTHDGPWAKLITCPWCAGPWIAAICLIWYLLGLLVYPPVFAAWWIFWGWLCLSYWVSQYVHFDEGKGE